MTTTTKPREIQLASRPSGWPTLANFKLVDTETRELADGELLVRNQFLSVDPYMRGRMNDVRSYVPPFEVGRVMDGGAVGVVVDSRSQLFSTGDTVLHGLGWREHAVGDAQEFRKVDIEVAPPSAFLGVLGMPGLTAFVGLVDIAGMQPQDTVFVSGAAGAVGSVAGQLARHRGAKRVIGSAGSPQKCAYLEDELGFDLAFNYKEQSVREQLGQAAPEGIDVFFDNVGGDQLEAAIAAMRTHGRIALCGAIAQYNDTEPQPGPRNLALAIGKRLTLRGFIVRDHSDRYGDFVTEVGGLLRDGKLKFRETIVDGIERMPETFIGLLRGDNIGKMLIRIPEAV